MPHIAHPQIRNRGTIGGSIAHADPAAELPAVSIAMKGRFRLRSRTKERWISADEFFVGFFTTVLEPDELLVEIALPSMPPCSGWAFLEVARRHGDYALVGIAAMVTLDREDRCQQVRLVFLSVGDGPVEAQEAAKILTGQPPTPQVIRAAADAAANVDIDPGSDIHASAKYRRHLAQILTCRVLEKAITRAGYKAN
jgi:carbon-monoxide dehydrogenase medium subunit